MRTPCTVPSQKTSHTTHPASVLCRCNPHTEATRRPRDPGVAGASRDLTASAAGFHSPGRTPHWISRFLPACGPQPLLTMADCLLAPLSSRLPAAHSSSANGTARATFIRGSLQLSGPEIPYPFSMTVCLEPPIG